MNDEAFTLTIRAQFNPPVQLEWKIIRKTDKANLVRTPGGDVWLPKWKFGEAKSMHYSALGKFLKELEDVARGGSTGCCRVSAAGKGPTQKSGKFRVKVLRKSWGGNGEPEVEGVSRTFTLPVSQIWKDANGKQWAPTWLFKERLEGNEVLADPVWPGIADVRAETQAIATQLEELDKRTVKLNWQEQQARKEQRQAAIDQRIEALAPDAPHLAKFLKGRFTLDKIMEGAGLSGKPSWSEIDSWPISGTGDLGLLLTLEKTLQFARQQPEWQAWRAKRDQL